MRHSAGVGSDTPLLSDIFEPQSIAVVGASPENTFGGRSLRYLEKLKYQLPVYPVNPHYDEIRGWRCYPDVSDIPSTVDVAVVAVPAVYTPKVMEGLGSKRCKVAVVLSAGFSESGPQGRELEATMLETAHRNGIRVVGPNCNGAINILDRIPLGCSTAMERSILQPGPVALISQSGSVGASIVDLAMSAGLGLSYVAATGNGNDLDVTAFVEMLTSDPRTEVVAVLMEGVRDGAAFLRAAKRLNESGKVLAVLKVGRSQSGAATVATHTGAMAGSWELFRELSTDAGAQVVDTIEDLVALCAAHASYSAARQHKQWGGRLQVISTSGALCGLIADTIEGIEGLSLANLTQDSRDLLATFGFRPPWNPLDFARVPMPEDRWAGNFLRITDALLGDPGVDGLLVGSGVSHIVSEVSEITVRVSADHPDKLTSIYSVGGELVAKARSIAAGRVVTAESLGALLKAIDHHTRRPSTPSVQPAHSRKARPAGKALAAMLVRPTEYFVTVFLGEHGLDSPQESIATSATDCLRAAEAVGYPVVLKASMSKPVHKSRMGLVRTGLQTATKVEEAFESIRKAAQTHDFWEEEVLIAQQVDLTGAVEILLGARRDPTFGLHLIVGAGGSLAEQLDDWKALPIDCDDDEIDRALRGLKILSDIEPREFEPLKRTVVKFREAVVDVGPGLAALEVNPCAFWGSDRPCLVLDARVELFDAASTRQLVATDV